MIQLLMEYDQMYAPPCGDSSNIADITNRRWGFVGRRRLMRICIALSMTFLGSCNRDEEGGGSSAGRDKPVTTIVARVDSLRETASGVGSLEAVEQVEIRAEIAGLVREILFEEGAQVARGDLLFRLDDAELRQQKSAREAALESAEADLTNARWNFERIRKLRDQGNAAVDEYKNARDRYDAAVAKVDRLEAEVRVIVEQIEDKQIRAATAGRITEHLVDVGDFVDAGDQLASLYTTDPLELAFWLPERCVPHVKTGQPVTATTVAYADREFDGTLAYVSPVVDPETRKLRVKARISNSDGLLKPGLFATGHVIVATHSENPLIPEECLVSLRSGYVVFVVEDDIARRRDIEIGLRRDGLVEIRSGVEPGARVVRTGHMRLREGDAVRIVTTESQPSSSTQSTTQPEPEALRA